MTNYTFKFNKVDVDKVFNLYILGSIIIIKKNQQWERKSYNNRRKRLNRRKFTRTLKLTDLTAF